MDVLRGLVTVTMNGALMYVEEIRGEPRVLACTKCRTKKAMAICGDLYCRDCCISCVADYHVNCKDFSAVRLLDHRLYGCTGASVVQSGVASVAKISHISDELVNTAVHAVPYGDVDGYGGGGSVDYDLYAYADGPIGNSGIIYGAPLHHHHHLRRMFSLVGCQVTARL